LRYFFGGASGVAEEEEDEGTGISFRFLEISEARMEAKSIV